MSSRLVNRNITADRGRTSMRLEPELWAALNDICAREGVTMGEMVRRIERLRHPGGRTSAVRVHIVEYYRRASAEAGRIDEQVSATLLTGHNGSQPPGTLRAEAQSASAGVSAGPV